MIVLSTILAITSLLIAVPEVWAADNRLGPPAGLDEAWNDRMLTGKFGRILDGKEEPGAFGRDSGKGWIHEASGSPTGIDVMDLRERRFLKSQGGWVLKGGRLGRVAVSDGTIELYGKTIERHEPFANPWPHVWIGMDDWTYAHEFFLLRRRNPADRASIIRKWVVPDAHRRSGLVLRGLVEYESTSATVVVKVMSGYEAGLFIERLHLSGASMHTRAEYAGSSASVVITRCPFPTDSPEPSADPLTRLWDTMMLAARFGEVRDGREPTSGAHMPFTAADGWANQVTRTTEAIIVSAKDNEPIRGGLLRRVAAGNATVELYAKQLAFDPRTYNRLVVWGGWGAGYEFFLLVRAVQDKQTTILRRWSFPFAGPGRLFLRGFLDYDDTRSTASVRITDGPDRTMVNDHVALHDCHGDR